MEYEKYNETLIALLPYWHYKIYRPFTQSQEDKMSLETYYCLQTLRRKGAMTMSEIARYLGITKQQATRTIDKLYRHQFVRRLDNESDRRFVRIEITPAAVEYIEKNVRRNTTFCKHIVENTGKTAVAELGAALETLMRILPPLLD